MPAKDASKKKKGPKKDASDKPKGKKVYQQKKQKKPKKGRVAVESGKKQTKYELQRIRRRKKLPQFLFKWLKPSRLMGNGGVMRKTSSLGRLMRWPKYVQLQRQRKVLLQRLKIPPALNIFNAACSKDFAAKLVRFCKGYSPETKKQKLNRLRANAKLQAEGKPIPDEKKCTLKFGFNHVTNLIEAGRAKLVLIAHDVDPIELVLWMPALCVKKNVTFCIFRSKARLGALVNRKTAACVALVDIKPGDTQDFKLLNRKAKQSFNGRYNSLKKNWGKRLLGTKTRHRIDKRKRYKRAEADRRKAAIS